MTLVSDVSWMIIKIPWHSLTYGDLFSSIRTEGLALCTKLRNQNKYQYEKKRFQNELKQFCEHFGYPKFEAPSLKKKKLHRRSSKNYPRRWETKNPYCQNLKKTFEGNLSNEKKNMASPSPTQVITCC